MTFSIMITTKNRCAELRTVLLRIGRLDPQPDEIIVTADGCTDETLEMVKTEKLKAVEQKPEVRSQKLEVSGHLPEKEKAETLKPEIKLIVNEVGRGSVASRDRMMREARGDLVLALDDDSYPEQLDCLATLQSFFAANENLAIATFPQRTDEYPSTLTQTDFGRESPVRSFANSGACFRVSTYRELAGFEPMFFHMYEEPDYALQCVAAGYEVRYFPQMTIRHHFSGATRNEMRNHHRHARNEFWSTLLRCPMPYALGMLGWRIFSQLRYACTRGLSWVICEPIWWVQALSGIAYCLRHRQPVTWAAYREWLSLR